MGGGGSNCEAFVSSSSPETGQFLIDLPYIRTDGVVRAQAQHPRWLGKQLRDSCQGKVEAGVYITTSLLATALLTTPALYGVELAAPAGCLA